MKSELKPCPCREAFEKWWCDCTGYTQDQIKIGYGDKYSNISAQTCWDIWQAAWNTRHGEI